MALFNAGNYKIFSTQFIGQDADLLGGQPTAIIGGYHNNTDSNNMVWKLANVGTTGNQFTLQNTASSCNGAYAGVQAGVTVGAQLHGSPTPLTWTAVGTCTAGEYMLLAPAAPGVDIPSGLVWSLDSAADLTPISLEVMSFTAPGSLYSRAGYSQAWTFLPWK